MPGRRVIIHAGFHKTGTTTVQHFLNANAKHLWKRCRLALPRHLRNNAARMATRYSQFQTPALLDAYANDLKTALSAIDVGEDRKLLISEENLAGRMPGRDNILSYASTPTLMARTEDVVCDIFGAETDVVFHFTTRAPDAWLRSTYKHILTSTRLTLDFAEYQDTYSPASDLSAAVDAVTSKVTGMVTTADLTTLTGPEGPAEPLLDLVGLPPHRRAAFEPVARKNISPSDDLLDALLELNRSNLPDDDLATAKKDLLKKGRTQ